MMRAALMLDPARSIRRAGIVWLLAIGSLVLVTVAFWPAFRGSAALSQAIDQIPSGLVQALGMQDFASPAGYLRGNLYDLLVPLLLAGAAIGFANTLTAAEEESGRLELTLAQPITRQAAYFGRAGAAGAWIVLVTAGLAATQFASNALFGLSIAPDRLFSTIVLCGLLAALHGAFAFAIAGFVPRPGLVVGLGLFVTLAGAIVSALFPLSSALSPWTGISPWDWALGGDPLVAPTAAWRYLVLTAPTATLLLAGAFGLTRRDVHAA